MEHNSFSEDRKYELWVLFNQARDALVKAREKELRPYGITSVQAAVLFIIQANGTKATAAKISRWLLREPHSVSCLLGRMEKEGLITKAKGENPKGPAHINLTDKGREAYRQSAKRVSIHKVLSVFSEAECQQLDSLLRKVRDQALTEIVDDPKPPFP